MTVGTFDRNDALSYCCFSHAKEFRVLKIKELTLFQFKRKRVNKFHRDLVGMFGKLPNPSAVVGTVDTS